MFGYILFFTGIIGVVSRMTEYIPILDFDKHIVARTAINDLPKSFSWSKVDGINYLTKKTKFININLKEF